MTTPHYTPRVRLKPRHYEGVSFGLAHDAGRIRGLLNLIRDEPDRLVQSRHYSLALEYRELGLGLYIVGYPLDQVRDAFAGMALAGLKVVELRAADEWFHKAVATLDPHDPRSADPHPPDERARGTQRPAPLP